MYCNKFFRTEEEAKAFKKSHGGALYKNIKGSHTRQAYRVEAMMAVFKIIARRQFHPWVFADETLT